MAAAICGHNDAVTLLLTNKASIDDRCEDGSTALMYAAMHGRTDTAALLLDHKADIALQNSVC